MINKRCVIVYMLLIFVFLVPSVSVQAGSIYESPYVTFSPDGKAFTTCEGDSAGTWYEMGKAIDTGIQSTIRMLNEGEHIYKSDRNGKIPIGKWKVTWKPGICCHDSYPPANKPYHGLKFRREICSSQYYSGWTAYCADCNESITPIYIYMSQAAAESITELDMDLEYYYLCPICTNLEQGAPLGVHKCEKISWNRYKIIYHKNSGNGYMESSMHMYNNESIYEGKEITRTTKLTKNAYTRIGFEFKGWNTKTDGTGIWYSDEQEILNLSKDNYNNDDRTEGVITLYAQWKRSESTLKINPNGGTYKGKADITAIKGLYRSTYTADPKDIQAPDGFRVSFETYGGDTIDAISQDLSFQEWRMESPFTGRMDGDVYTYLGKDGMEDTITAIYQYHNITLPDASYPGKSFGGWYYDPECRNPAGSAGDPFTPENNITLYAKWVDLVLTSIDNYTANQRRGAVDLSWEQKDDKSKTYLIFQSLDNVNWTKVSSAEDTASQIKVEESFYRNGTFTIPYSGLYVLSASGAQGGSYGSNPGGQGGSISGTVWLDKEDKLTLAIGGQDGSNGGGKGTMFANGGGYTQVTSEQKGELLIAGGGGGATSQGAGGSGGSAASVISSGRQGQEGGAGGGGGYQGGSAGEYVVHTHTPACFLTEDLGYTLFRQTPFTNEAPFLSPEFNAVSRSFGFTGSFYGNGTGDLNATAVASGSAGAYANMSNIPVKGNTQVEFHVVMDSWTQFGYSGQDPIRDQWGNIIGYDARYGDETYVRVYTQDGTCIYDQSAKSIAGHWSNARNNARNYGHSIDSYVNSLGGYFGRSSGWFWSDQGNEKSGKCRAVFNEVLNLPPGTTSLRFETNVTVSESHYGVNWAGISLKGGLSSVTICGYQEGQVVSAKPAYGGSSYSKPGAFLSSKDQAGVQAGNGCASLTSISIGFLEELSLKGVKATDLAAPGAIADAAVTRTPISEDAVSVSWQKPADYGTLYYHKAQSYLAGSDSLLSQSNVTANRLTSGIQGYYYVTDQDPSTVAGKDNGAWLEDYKGENLTVTLEADILYLHLAAADRAGNIGPTTHVKLGRKDTEVAWKLQTDKLQISSKENNIYPAKEPDTYYVRCDGKTPFTLTFDSFLLGQASASYQVNHTIFNSVLPQEGEEKQIYDIITPSHEITPADIITRADGLGKEITGDVILEGGEYTVTTRSDSCRKLSVEQQFLLGTRYHGRIIHTIPTAGADFKKEVQYSDRTADEANGIFLIGDLEPPRIQGTEVLKELDLINRGEENITLELSARDDLSGVRQLTVDIYNLDNAGSRTIQMDESGVIKVDITKDSPLFYGDFGITVTAVDNVGNIAQEAYGATEFTLTADIVRMLSPHNPVFQTGESGILTIVTGGYADRVEVKFPKEMLKLNPKLDKVYEYEVPRHLVKEELEFMVPLYTKEGSYQLEVYAYKDGRLLQENPALATFEISGTVTDDFRTRLR